MVLSGPAAIYAMDVVDSVAWHIQFGAFRLLRDGTASNFGAMESQATSKPETGYKNVSFQTGERLFAQCDRRNITIIST